MPKYLSGRVKRTPQNRLSDDRYQYLGLDQAEPNMGDPPTVSGTPGIPVGQQYQLVSVLSNPGERYWKPVGGGLIPGSISVYDEGSLVGSISSITQLDFVGNAIEVNAVALGITATITVKPPGNNGNVLYKDSDDFATSSNLIFNGTVGILTVGKGLEVGDTGLKVGVGGTFLTVTSGIGSVGIGITLPTQEFDLSGDARLRGTIYDFNNDPGAQGNILTKGASGLEWNSNNSVKTGAGGTIYDVQYHNTAGLVDGAPNFVYRSDTSRVGIGSTQPKVLLDVVGISSLRGGVFIDEPYITGVSTFTGQIKATNGIVANTARIEDLTETRVVFSGPSGELVDDADFSYNATSDTLDLTNVVISGQTQAQDLKVIGVSTLGNVKVGLTTITTTTGALTLDAASGSIQSNAGIFINVTTDSTNKDSGALTVDGGLGVEKNVNIGAKLSVVGVTTLASAGGITTTGGDLYVGNDLFVKGNFAIEEGSFQRLIVNPGVSTFKGDVEFFSDYVGAAKSAYWDESANSLNLVSGTKLNLGSSNELTIYYNGYNGNSYITESGTGNLYIQSSNSMYLQNAGGTKNYAIFNDGKSVDLYNDNLKKFSTSGTGATIFGQLDAETAVLTSTLTVDGTSNLKGNVNLGDAVTDNVIFNAKVNSTVLPNTDSTYDLGSSALRWREIYADKFIGLDLLLTDLVVTGIATFKDDVEFWGNSGVAKSAYWDKSDDSFKFVDDAQLKFGDSNDLKIYHTTASGGYSVISEDGTGQLVIGGNIIELKNEALNQTLASFNGSSSVDLYFNNSKRFETFDKGIGVYGNGSSVGGGVSFYNGPNTYHTKIKALDGLSANYTLTLPPDDGDSGDLLKSDGSGNLDWIPQSSIQAQPGGSDTELQYNDGGNFGGIPKLTYNDSNSNLYLTGNNVGVASAYWNSSSNEFIFNDDAYLKFGTDEDLEIYHDTASDQSIIKATSKIISIMSGNAVEIEDETGVNIAQFKKTGGSILYHDGGLQKFTTTSDGVKITGGLQDKDSELGTAGQVLASTGTELNWVDAAIGSVVTVDVKQDNYCAVDDSVFNPITVTPTSVGVTTVSIATTSNAYGRKFVQDDDPTSVAGGSYTVCNGDIWYDTTP